MPLTAVLSVGSDSSLLGIRRLVLRSAGYIVESAQSVKEAVDRFLSGDFDLVILCHSIPTKERDRLTCLIRASGSRIPVVSISGNHGQFDPFANATIEEGHSKFLTGIREVLLKAARISAACAAIPGDRQQVTATPVEKTANLERRP